VGARRFPAPARDRAGRARLLPTARGGRGSALHLGPEFRRVQAAAAGPNDNAFPGLDSSAPPPAALQAQCPVRDTFSGVVFFWRQH